MHYRRWHAYSYILGMSNETKKQTFRCPVCDKLIKAVPVFVKWNKAVKPKNIVEMALCAKCAAKRGAK